MRRSQSPTQPLALVLDIPFTVPGTATPRSLKERFAAPVNILDFIPLGTYARMLDNTNTDDLAGYFNTAIAELRTLTGTELGSALYCPRGWYRCLTPIIVPTTSTGYLADMGIMIFGEGMKTVFSQDKRGALDVVDYSDPDIYVNQAVFRIHASKTILRDVAFNGCVSAIYVGQDPDTAGSEVSMCRLQSLDIGQCGTGIHLACSVGPSTGNKYNSIDDVFAWQCQIGVHMREFGATTSNNNRARMSMVRVARSNVGFWIENGDTNLFSACHTEGCHADVSSTPYALPAGTPDAPDMPGTPGSYGWILHTDALSNVFENCCNESNDADLHNSGGACRWKSGRFDPEKCVFAVAPLEFNAADNLRITDFYNFLNTGTKRTDIFANYVPGYEYSQRPQVIGVPAWAGPDGAGEAPASGLRAQVLIGASAGSNRHLGMLAYDNSATTVEVFGAKTDGDDPDSFTVPAPNRILIDVHGRMADGVDDYVKGAGIQVQNTGTPSPTSAQSVVRILAVGAASLARVVSAIFDAAADAVNHIRVFSNVTAANPYMQMEGPDTNIGFGLIMKGNGSLVLRGNGASGGNLAIFEGDAAATKALRFFAGNAGADAQVGTAANDLRFTPASGIIRFGTHTAIAGETITGYITVKDETTGTSRKLAVVS